MILFTRAAILKENDPNIRHNGIRSMDNYPKLQYKFEIITIKNIMKK
jgi:hypothetical protein